MNKLINEVLEIYEEANAVGIAYNLKKGLSAYFVHDYECIPTKYRICVLDKTVCTTYEEIEFALHQVLSQM